MNFRNLSIVSALIFAGGLASGAGPVLQGKGEPPAKGGTPVQAGAPAKDTPGKAAPEGKTGAPGQALSPDMEAKMKKCIELGTPGAEHKLLAQNAGKWTFTNKCWMAPGTPAMESSGNNEIKSVMDGRFVQNEVHGDMMGQPFHGVATCGFDNAKKKYVSTWIDNMGTAIMMFEGTYDAATKTITSKGEMPDPLTGKMSPVRMVERMDSPDQMTMEMYSNGPDGKEFKTMEIVYKRAKQA
jgi:hypothetical protein